MERVILHCDLNSFFASVEQLYHPESYGHPVAVGYSEDKRHGIILAKNTIAKKYGIETAEPIYSAYKKCPNLILYPPHYSRYVTFSRKVRKIFLEYTDLVEPFGIDEAWLDVTNSKIFGTGEEIANEIRERIKNELGITASVGVSFNKIFAKLGSDLRKPNYTTVISKENFKELVWPLKANEMIYIGKSTYKKLNELGIYTIGELANSDPKVLKRVFDDYAYHLINVANGIDNSVVLPYDYHQDAKSIGCSTTCHRDLKNFDDLNMVFIFLSEEVAERLRKEEFLAKEITVSFRDNELKIFTRQAAIDNPTNLAYLIKKEAMKIARRNYSFNKPLRSVGIRVSKFIKGNQTIQMSLFEDNESLETQEKLEKTIDDIRSRYGHNSITSLSLLKDKDLCRYAFTSDASDNNELLKK